MKRFCFQSSGGVVLLILLLSACASQILAVGGYVHIRTWDTITPTPPVPLDNHIVSPRGIAKATDGAIWLSEASPNCRIWRIMVDADYNPTHFDWFGACTAPEHNDGMGHWHSAESNHTPTAGGEVGGPGGPGMFYDPYGIAFDSLGKAYISDQQNIRVQILDGVTTSNPQWIGYLLDSSDFVYPCGDTRFVAIDSANNVYLSEFWGNVVKFDSSGSWTTSWPVSFALQGIAVATADSDTVYACSELDSLINKYSATGDFLGSWGQTGSAPGQFTMPTAVKIGPDGNVFVSESLYTNNSRIQVFSPTGQYQNRFLGQFGTGPGQTACIQDFCVDSDGFVYVSDDTFSYLGDTWSNHRVEVFAPADKVVKVLSPNGGETLTAGSTVTIQWKSLIDLTGVKIEFTMDNGINWFTVVSNAPNTGTYDWTVPAVRSSNCRIRITDLVNPEIADSSDALFQTQGCAEGGFVSVGTWGTIVNAQGDVFGHIQYPTGIAKAPDGTVWMAEAYPACRIWRIRVNPDGTCKFLEWFGGCDNAEHSGEGHWHSVDSDHTPVAGGYEGLTIDPGQFKHPTGIAFDFVQKRAYVVDHHNYRVQILSCDRTSDPLPEPFIGFLHNEDDSLCVLAAPHYVAMDSANNIYVDDHLNQRVAKFDSTGKLIPTDWNTGTFLQGIAVDKTTDSVFLCSVNDSQVRKYTTDGVLLDMWGTDGTGPGEFTMPTHLEIGPDGNVFVSESWYSGNCRIQVFSQSGEYQYQYVGAFGTGPGEMVGNDDFFVDLNGFVFTTDYSNLDGSMINNRVHIFAPCGWPTPEAGDSVTIKTIEQSTTVIQGSATDPENDPMEFRWCEGTTELMPWTVVGPTGECWLNLADLPRLSRENHTLTLQVRQVGETHIVSDTMVLTVLNTPPTANAGLPQTEHPGNKVTLDGSGSYDYDGDMLTFEWMILSRPVGSLSELDDPTLVNPSFIPDMLGDYTLLLVVTDAWGDFSDPAIVLISTTNSKPMADAGLDQALLQLHVPIQLGTDPDHQSYDPDEEDTITYLWILEVPAGSATVLDNPTSATPSFTPDSYGTYTVTLVVSDPWVDSDADSVVISFENIAPVAVTNGNQSKLVNDTVTLDGTGSTDANLDVLSYQWNFVTKPADSEAEIDDPTAATTSFIADMPGTYVVSLTVNDGLLSCNEPATATILVISYPCAVIHELQHTISIINHLPCGSFRNRMQAHMLTNKINAVIATVELARWFDYWATQLPEYAQYFQGMADRLYDEAAGRILCDLIPKTDGCATKGAPDRNDWIITCTAQEPVYDSLNRALILLILLPD